MSRFRFCTATLFWLITLVAVFFLSRQPIFDPLFPNESSSRILELEEVVNWHVCSDPNIVRIEKLNAQACRITPVTKGVCAVQFKTPTGARWFVVSESAVKNVSIQPIAFDKPLVHWQGGGRI